MNRRNVRRPAAPARAGVERNDVLLAAALAAATLAVYAQAWGFEFVTVDDSRYFCPEVQRGLTFEGLKWSVAGVHDSNWFPLTWLSLMLDTEIYGARAAGYHLTNVLLHTANSVLLFLALRRATGARGRSAVVAGLFALHPLHVESVAWIAERKDVLSIFWGLLSLGAYVRYASTGRKRTLAASLALFVASLLSKQTLVTFPCVLLLLDYWPLERFRDRHSATRLVVEKLPFLAASAGFSAIALAAQSQGGATMTLGQYPLWVRVLNALQAYAVYLGKTVYPRNLAVYYPHPGAAISVAGAALAAALLVAVSAAAVAAIRRYPCLFVGWFWYLGTLVPMIGLVQIGSQSMADRYTYFPLIGVFLAAAWLTAEVVPAGVLRARVLPAAAVSYMLLLAVTTASQASYWHDSVTLTRHSLECTADNPVAHEFLGSALLGQGPANMQAFHEGMAEIEKSIRLSPRFAPTHFTLAAALQHVGRLDEAVGQYQEALALDERMVMAHVNLAAILQGRNQTDEARKHLLRAIEIDAACFFAHANLATLELAAGDNAAAISEAERALALEPHQHILHWQIARALRNLGRYDEAADRLRRLLAMTPDDEFIRRELAETIAAKQKSSAK